MARHESDREDLMREATALVRRIELRVPGEAESVVAGFRAEGRLSIYFGAGAAYHFDEQGRLRRAFVAGDLFRTQGDTLARLTRTRTPQTVELRRHDLLPGELDGFRSAMLRNLERLLDGLQSGRAEILRNVPAGEDLCPAVGECIHGILAAGAPLAPAIRGKS